MGVAQLVIAPTIFMTILLFIFGIVDSKPLPLFLGVWSLYQSVLLIVAHRRNAVAKLPLFQLLEDTLRHSKGRQKKSMDVGQKNRKYANNTDNAVKVIISNSNKRMDSVATETAGSEAVVESPKSHHIVEATVTKDEESELKTDEVVDGDRKLSLKVERFEKSKAVVASGPAAEDIGDAIEPMSTLRPTQADRTDSQKEDNQDIPETSFDIQPSITQLSQLPSISATASNALRPEFGGSMVQQEPELLTIDMQRNDSITPAPMHFGHTEISHDVESPHEESAQHVHDMILEDREISITQKSTMDPANDSSMNLAV